MHMTANTVLEADDVDDIESVSILKPRPRNTSFPPMPDLRFEQSYLHSIRDADRWWKVALITLKDQVRTYRPPSFARRHSEC